MRELPLMPRAALPTVDVFIAGSSWHEHPGGWAAVLQYVGADGKLVEREISGDGLGCYQTMVLLAAIAALEALNRRCRVCVSSRSKTFVHCASGKYNRSSDRDLWQRFESAAAPHEISWQFVPAGFAEIDRALALSRKAVPPRRPSNVVHVDFAAVRRVAGGGAPSAA